MKKITLLTFVMIVGLVLGSQAQARSFNALYVAGKVHWPTMLALEFGLDSGSDARFRIFGGYWSQAILTNISSSYLSDVASLPDLDANLERTAWQIGLIADFYPLVNTSADGFKLSLGLVVDWDQTSYKKTLPKDSYLNLAGNSTFINNESTITLEANNTWLAAPYVGIGYDLFRQDEGLLVNIEIGGIYTAGFELEFDIDTRTSPSGELAENIEKERETIEDKLKLASLYNPFKIIGGVTVGWQF